MHKVFSIIKEEVILYSECSYSFKNFVKLFLFNGGFQLNFTYRISHYWYKKNERYTWGIYLFTSIGRIITSSYIHPRAIIGPRAYIAYGLGIIIGSHVQIGSDCRIFSGCSLASANPGMDEIVQPKVGDRVMIGTGAKLLGDVTIGNDSVIGANAVVTKSFGDGAVIVGIPAKNIKKD